MILVILVVVKREKASERARIQNNLDRDIKKQQQQQEIQLISHNLNQAIKV